MTMPCHPTADEELLIDWLSKQRRFQAVTIKGEARVCCLSPNMGLWGILAGLHNQGYRDSWWYRDRERAKAAFDAWDGTGEPRDWYRHPNSGRRREDDGAEYVIL